MRVGFVGLGQMGEGMALRIAGAGHALSVSDLRPAPVTRLEQAGARRVTDNAELGAASDVVCIAVYGEQTARDVCLPPDGVLSGMRPGSILIVHCTLSSDTMVAISAAAAEKGVAMLEATLSGGGEQAARLGELTMMIGGSDALLERVRPLLSAMATNIFHIGPIGAASNAKFINNFVVVTEMAAIREALEVAASIGIDEETMLGIFNAGRMATSWKTQNWQAVREMEKAHDGGNMAGSARKDMEVMAQLASAGGTIAPLAGFMEQLLPSLRNGLTR